MTAIYLLRHPQTTWNATSRYQGRLNSPLSPEGKQQSRLVARAFAGSELAAVYSSPLNRALYLARELAQATEAPVVVDQRLTEIGQCTWEGLHVQEIERRFPDLYRLWRTYPDQVTFPGGETLEQVHHRSQAVLAHIFATHPGCHVAAVTHSVVIQVLAAAALRLPLGFIHHLPVHNASVTTLCGRESPGRILSINVTDALYHSPVASAVAQACVS